MPLHASGPLDVINSGVQLEEVEVRRCSRKNGEDEREAIECGSAPHMSMLPNHNTRRTAA